MKRARLNPQTIAALCVAAGAGCGRSDYARPLPTRHQESIDSGSRDSLSETGADASHWLDGTLADASRWPDGALADASRLPDGARADASRQRDRPDSDVSTDATPWDSGSDLGQRCDSVPPAALDCSRPALAGCGSPCFSCGCAECLGATNACLADPGCRKIYACSLGQECLGEEECATVDSCERLLGNLRGASPESVALYDALAECLRWGGAELEACWLVCGLGVSTCDTLGAHPVCAGEPGLPVGWSCPQGEIPPKSSYFSEQCETFQHLWCCAQ